MNDSPLSHEARLASAIAVANVPVLIPLLVMLTGDGKWLEAPYAPARSQGIGDNPTGGLPDEVQAEIRSAALGAITAHLNGRPAAMAEPDDAMLVRMLSVAMGETVPAEYGPMIAAELGLERSVAPQPAFEVPDGFEVLIIGAGPSGLAMAITLQQAGIPFMIAERNDDVGGSWLVNRYPGAGVDTPSALYSFSFAPYNWSQYFAPQHELRVYLRGMADDHHLDARIEYSTSVDEMVWLEDSQAWQVRTRTSAGVERIRTFSFVVSAVGGLTRPKLPDLPGLDDFAGRVVHTAEWPDDLDLTAKRVGIIGAGASAMQTVPAIVGEVAHLSIFQRSPQWVAPFAQHGEEVPELLRFLSAEVRLYRLWYRQRAGWTFNDRVYAGLQKDPTWEHPERAVNKINDAYRKHFTRYIQAKLGGRPDLIEKALPTYPPYGKRILLDNGWYDALLRDNVELVADPIDHVEASGVNCRETGLHTLDVLICATGFDAAHFLAPLRVVGTGGHVLREIWDDDDPRAYLGMSVPGFPNFFMIYGPNTQAGHGGSLIGSAEVQIHHILDVVQQMLAGRVGAVEARPTDYESYNAKVDELHENMIWTHPGMSTYYRNSRGRVVVPTPFRVVDYWHMARQADLTQYDCQPATEMKVVSA
jgi:4-hydroxyacetophenone monooxygenase